MERERLQEELELEHLQRLSAAVDEEETEVEKALSEAVATVVATLINKDVRCMLHDKFAIVIIMKRFLSAFLCVVIILRNYCTVIT